MGARVASGGVPMINDNAVYLPNRPGQPMMVFGRGVA